MRTALLLFVLILADDRAQKHFDQMTIVPPDPGDNVSRRVVVTLLEKRHWVGAFSEIADKFGRFPDDLSLTVDFKLAGQNEVARTSHRPGECKVSFNLPKLTELQKQLDDIEKMKREGKQVVFKVPPLKIDRVIYHELAHVLQGGSDAPKWFVEGMAQLAGDDPNSLYQFVKDGRRVQGIDVDISDGIATYARGHLFWKWLDARGASARAFELVFVKKLPVKQALEEATNKSWDSILATEQEWSAREIEKLK